MPRYSVTVKIVHTWYEELVVEAASEDGAELAAEMMAVELNDDPIVDRYTYCNWMLDEAEPRVDELNLNEETEEEVSVEALPETESSQVVAKRSRSRSRRSRRRSRPVAAQEEVQVSATAEEEQPQEAVLEEQVVVVELVSAPAKSRSRRRRRPKASGLAEPQETLPQETSETGKAVVGEIEHRPEESPVGQEVSPMEIVQLQELPTAVVVQPKEAQPVEVELTHGLSSGEMEKPLEAHETQAVESPDVVPVKPKTRRRRKPKTVVAEQAEEVVQRESEVPELPVVEPPAVMEPSPESEAVPTKSKPRRRRKPKALAESQPVESAEIGTQGADISAEETAQSEQA